MSNTPYAILSWNVRGLNSPARIVVREVAEAHRASILCLQETKLEAWTPSIVRDIGGCKLEGRVMLPAMGYSRQCGYPLGQEQIVVCHTRSRLLLDTGRFSALQDNSFFWLTTVYGPVDDARTNDFLAELAHAVPPHGEPWLINDDFNIIYEARDKNNLNLNKLIMGRFRAAIDSVGLREIKCKNRRYTWSNEREDPTMVSIDKVFCNLEWEALFPSYMAMAAATACSDHCPLLLTSLRHCSATRESHFVMTGITYSQRRSNGPV